MFLPIGLPHQVIFSCWTCCPLVLNSSLLIHFLCGYQRSYPSKGITANFLRNHDDMEVRTAAFISPVRQRIYTDVKQGKVDKKKPAKAGSMCLPVICLSGRCHRIHEVELHLLDHPANVRKTLLDNRSQLGITDVTMPFQRGNPSQTTQQILFELL